MKLTEISSDATGLNGEERLLRPVFVGLALGRAIRTRVPIEQEVKPRLRTGLLILRLHVLSPFSFGASTLLPVILRR